MVDDQVSWLFYTVMTHMQAVREHVLIVNVCLYVAGWFCNRPEYNDIYGCSDALHGLSGYEITDKLWLVVWPCNEVFILCCI